HDLHFSTRFPGPGSATADRILTLEVCANESLVDYPNHGARGVVPGIDCPPHQQGDAHRFKEARAHHVDMHIETPIIAVRIRLRCVPLDYQADNTHAPAERSAL